MPVRQLPDNCFAVAQLARDLGIDPRLARGRLRKAVKDGKPVPECEKGPHVFNMPWVFNNKAKLKVSKLIQAEGTPTKAKKVEAESDEAAHDLAAE